jgi:hypothetical protein
MLIRTQRQARLINKRIAVVFAVRNILAVCD